MNNPKFTKEMIQECREAFDALDTDGSQSICLDEIKVLCQQLGTQVSDEEIIEKMAIIDKNSNGKIEFNEFLKFYANLM